MNLVIFGQHEERTIHQLEACLTATEPEAKGVICADGHPGYSMPIGGVLASQQAVIPAGVGYDIGCGNCAVRTDINASDVDTRRVMDEIANTISFGMGRRNEERITEHPVFDAIATSPVLEQRALLEQARPQLGTVGSGNHYVDLFEDRADGRLWVGVHFGSRGFGHKTATGFLALAAGKEWGARVNDDMDAPPLTVPIHTPTGQDYLAAMEIAGQYAYAGRNWVIDRVLRILGAHATLRVHNHHNYAWWEEHEGARWLVIRKGATPAFPGQRGFVGGSMGDDAVILEGMDTPQSRTALFSTVHGAGRVMGRMQAAGKTKHTTVWACGQRDCTGELPIQTKRIDNANPLCPACGSKTHRRQTETVLREGLVNWPEWQAILKAEGVELRGGGADESPQCYKRLPDVLRAHGDTVRVLHTLRVIGVAMAGRDVIDPYKD